MAPRIPIVDSDNPILPESVRAASIGTTTGTFADGGTVADVQSTAESAASTADGAAAAAAIASQEYPPLDPVAGSRWYVPSVGHMATWSGTAWVAQTPADPEINVCCILGSFVGLWAPDAGTGAVNVGSGGSALNGTIDGGLAASTDTSGRPVWVFDGVDDRVSVADHALLNFGASESLTLFAVVAGPLDTSNRAIVGKRNGFGGPTTGYHLLRGANPQFRISDGAFISATVETAIGADIAMLVGVRDVAEDHIVSYLDGVAGTTVEDTTTGSLTTTIEFKIAHAVSTYTAMSGYCFGLARRALTETEVGALALWREERWA